MHFQRWSHLPHTSGPAPTTAAGTTTDRILPSTTVPDTGNNDTANTGTGTVGDSGRGESLSRRPARAGTLNLDSFMLGEGWDLDLRRNLMGGWGGEGDV